MINTTNWLKIGNKIKNMKIANLLLIFFYKNNSKVKSPFTNSFCRLFEQIEIFFTSFLQAIFQIAVKFFFLIFTEDNARIMLHNFPNKI